MSVAAVDYAKLLVEAEPQVIHTRQVYQRYRKKLREMMARDASLTKQERRLFELLATLAEDYEKRTFSAHGATPLDIIEHLMDANNLKRKDMVGIFESASVVSDVLNGKRSLTVDHIRRLSERFQVSPALFF